MPDLDLTALQADLPDATWWVHHADATDLRNLTAQRVIDAVPALLDRVAELERQQDAVWQALDLDGPTEHEAMLTQRRMVLRLSQEPLTVDYGPVTVPSPGCRSHLTGQPWGESWCAIDAIHEVHAEGNSRWTDEQACADEGHHGPTTEETPKLPHVYLGTYCVHGLCDQCKQTCKTCGSPCVHECHKAAATVETPAPDEVHLWSVSDEAEMVAATHAALAAGYTPDPHCECDGTCRWCAYWGCEACCDSYANPDHGVRDAPAMPAASPAADETAAA